MALDYSQKQLLNTSLFKTKKTKGKRGILSSMRRKQNFMGKLQVYAFWTGFMSTLISLCQVIIIALKK